MKLKSFGCSFIFGSDLADGGVDGYHTASNFTWPALLAQRFGLDYTCYAHPGTGNLRILEQVLKQSADKDSLFVITKYLPTKTFRIAVSILNDSFSDLSKF